MIDLGKTIEPKSDQLNSDDLIAGPITITVRKVSLNTEVEQPISIHYEGDNGKPYKACKSMRRVLVQVWGRDGNAYVGKSMTLYREPTVKFGGLEVGGIRISHMSDIDKPVTMALTATRASRKPYTVKPLQSGAKPSQINHEPILEAAKAAAEQGKDAFNAHWKALTKDQRAIVATIMDDLKAMAIKADEPPAVDEPTVDDYNGDITEPFEGETDTKDVF